MTTDDGMMDCDAFATALADYLEGDLSGEARRTMDAHVVQCGGCTALLAELGELREAAAALPTLEPARDLWAGIAERLPTRVLALDDARSARVRRGAVWRRPAVAAAALVLAAAGLSHVWTRQVYEHPAPTVATSTMPAARDGAGLVPAGGEAASGPEGANVTAPSAVGGSPPGIRGDAPLASRRAMLAAGGGRGAAASAVRLASRPGSASAVMRTEAEPVYDREITRLRAIVRERRAQLDPATVAVLERSIAVIDSAIAQSRAALARDSASAFLATQLNRSLEKKVELLRLTAQLPART